MIRARWLLVALAVLAPACVADPQQTEPLGANGSLEDFRTYVQPVLQVGCASLDCHGNEGRPLRLYALNGLRNDATLRGQDATEAEMRANMLAIRGLQPEMGSIEDSLLLLKPLSVQAGGINHVGGDLFIDQNDRRYRCLHAWLRAGVSDDAGRAICMQVLP